MNDVLLLAWDEIERNIQAHRELIEERGVHGQLTPAYLAEIERMNRVLQTGATVTIQTTNLGFYQPLLLPESNTQQKSGFDPYIYTLTLRQVVVGPPHKPDLPGRISYAAHYVFWIEPMQYYHTGMSALTPHNRWQEMLAQIEKRSEP